MVGLVGLKHFSRLTSSHQVEKIPNHSRPLDRWVGLVEISFGLGELAVLSFFFIHVVGFGPSDSTFW